MYRRYLTSIVLFAFVTSLSGCGGGERLSPDVTAILEKADEIELYSLNPDKRLRKAGTGLEGWQVLGQTTLSGDEKTAIVKALQKGIAASDGSVAACFNPRHGIEATHDGKRVVLIICFECSSISGSIDGAPFSVLTSGRAADEFNRVLTANKVPLPKPAE